MEEIFEQAKKIKLALFDVDGILTSGNLTYGPEGIEIKDFHVHDGQGIKFLKKTGVEIGIITACKTLIIQKRINDLNIEHLYQGTSDKLPAYEDIKAKLNLNDEEIAYMGDDLPDLPILKRVGFATTAKNANPIVKEHVHYITESYGGNGAAREVCDIIMQAQGTYKTIIDSYLKR